MVTVSRNRAMMATLVIGAGLGGVPAARQTCGATGPFALDSQYAPDHLNYLCTNWTRSTPLPCDDAASHWDARWLGREKYMTLIQNERTPLDGGASWTREHRRRRAYATRPSGGLSRR